MRIETSYLFYFIDRAVEPSHDLVQNMFFFHLQFTQLKKKQKTIKNWCIVICLLKMYLGLRYVRLQNGVQKAIKKKYGWI